MTSVVVVTQDAAITVAQDNPAINAVIPVTQFPTNKLGISLSQTMPAAADFNTITTAGFYYTNDVLSTNTPVAGHLWYLNVDVDGAFPTLYLRQIATILDVAPTTTYVRIFVNGAWGAWQQSIFLDGSGRLPAVDGSLLSNINVGPTFQNYINGLTISQTAGTGNFSIASGVANDSTNAVVMKLASALSKTTSAWSAGNGGGALDSGSILPNQFYHKFIIENPTTGVVDVIISISLVPALPTGFTLYRYIGSGETDASSHWYSITQVGDTFIRNINAGDVNTTIGTTPTLFSLSVPTGFPVDALIRSGCANATPDVLVLINSPDEAAAVPNAIQGNFTTLNDSSSLAGFATLRVRTNSLGQVRAVAQAAGTSFTIATYGWVDPRGKL